MRNEEEFYGNDEEALGRIVGFFASFLLVTCLGAWVFMAMLEAPWQ